MIWTERHNFTGGNLTIQRLKPADSGMYQCFVSNKHGQMHADIELTVSGKIQSISNVGCKSGHISDYLVKVTNGIQK